MDNISIKKATMINAMAKYSQIIFNIIFNIILARILSPNDYGIVAIITVFTTFFNILADMGLGPAVIQNKNLREKDISSIFAFSIYLAVTLAIIFSLLAFPISIIYSSKVYLPLCWILSLSIAFNTLNMVPNALLLKDKLFKVVALRTIITTICTSVIAVILALLGFKYYSLVIQSVLNSFITFLWNYKTVNIKFSVRVDNESLKKVKDFSLFQFAFTLVNYLARNLDNLFIGTFMGSTAIAYYDKGYKLMQYPINNLTNVITPVLQPILSDYQNNPEYIFKKYVKIVRILSLIGVYISLCCFFMSKEIILIMYGSQWYAAIPCFKWLSLSVWSQMLMSSTGAIYQSLGKTKLLFKSGFITAIVTVSSILFGLHKGTVSDVAFMILLAFSINFVITFYLLIKKCFQLPLYDFFKLFKNDLIIGTMLCIVLYISKRYISFNNSFISLIVNGTIGSAIYVVGLLITGEYRVFIKLIKKDV
ncbi:lipopolysaccharide biosynthesis protein [Clostridium omnivorum]|uniref:Lipopolysaccharide biosynthesis protein n=1 Tax=Clostridium omnivorum TaxID=1604902 RepID=A0ABQ5N3H5_9CLOT|nr:lipopolysaccharide biosynthesis protein [Clostridium sp. E14]GLC29706.1 lipopolysaccharide biosynthesis protein [Clostridium sp. E14]